MSAVARAEPAQGPTPDRCIRCNQHSPRVTLCSCHDPSCSGASPGAAHGATPMAIRSRRCIRGIAKGGPDGCLAGGLLHCSIHLVLASHPPRPRPAHSAGQQASSPHTAAGDLGGTSFLEQVFCCRPHMGAQKRQYAFGRAPLFDLSLVSSCFVPGRGPPRPLVSAPVTPRL